MLNTVSELHRWRYTSSETITKCGFGAGLNAKTLAKFSLTKHRKGLQISPASKMRSLERRIVENNAFHGVLRTWYVDMLNKVSKVHRLRYTSSETITKCGFGAGLNAKILAKLSLTKNRKELEKQPITARASSQQATSTQ